MKTIIKNVILFFALFAAVIGPKLNANAQTNLSILQSKTWVMQFPSVQTYTVTVNYKTTGEELNILSYDGKVNNFVYRYYLSNSIESTFNSAKVGKADDGKYIIAEQETKQEGGPIMKIVAVYEILKLDANNLELKNLRNSSILTYKPKF